MKHLETPWNRAMKHRETEWNRAVKHVETTMKQQWNSMKQYETAMKQQWNSMKLRSEIPWTKNQYKKIDISVLTVPDSRCFIGMKQCVSWPWNTVSSWFKVFHDHVSSCFNMFHGVSRPWNKLFHYWFILIQHVSSLFHRSDSSGFMLIQPVSSLFYHCFIIVSSLFHPWERAFRLSLIHNTTVTVWQCDRDIRSHEDQVTRSHDRYVRRSLDQQVTRSHEDQVTWSHDR